MSRRKEFDPDIALDRALELFWERGYEATSTAELVEHLGIGRASMYATFGSKHELYLKALDRYLLKQDPSPLELLSRPGPALPLIHALVKHYAHESACDLTKRGCMVVNAVTERLPGDKEVAKRIEIAWDALEMALAAALHRALAQGELAADKDPRAIARFLLVFLQGIRVVSKSWSDPDRFRDAVNQALKVLE